MLQVLFETKQTHAAWPILSYLEIKVRELQNCLSLKSNIKTQDIKEEEVKNVVGG